MQWTDRGWYLVVEFEKSTSCLFDDALQLARLHGSYCQLMDHRGHVFHRVVFGEGEVQAAIRLLDVVAQWRRARAYLKGHEAPPAAVRCQLDCYAWRQARGRLQECPLLPTGDWPFPQALGCQWGRVMLNWLDDSRRVSLRPWFLFGRIERGHVLVISKRRLRQRVEAEARARGACPIFGAARLPEIVERLPDSIDVEAEPEWRLEVTPTRRSALCASCGVEPLPSVSPKSVGDYRRLMVRLLDGLQFPLPPAANRGA